MSVKSFGVCKELHPNPANAAYGTHFHWFVEVAGGRLDCALAAFQQVGTSGQSLHGHCKVIESDEHMRNCVAYVMKEGDFVMKVSKELMAAALGSPSEPASAKRKRSGEEHWKDAFAQAMKDADTPEDAVMVLVKDHLDVYVALKDKLLAAAVISAC
jgi:hypothetical protein